jgi:hypothetical protein
MKSPKIKVASTVEKLNKLIADVAAADKEAKEHNAKAIADSLQLVINKEDAFTTSGVSDKVTFKRVSEDLVDVTDSAQTWVNTLSVVTDEVVELDGGELEDLSELLATKVVVEEFKGRAEFSLVESYED